MPVAIKDVKTIFARPEGAPLADLHQDLWAPNFGVQECCRPELARRNPEGAKLNQRFYDMFPGLLELRSGYMYPNDGPGLGIYIDEDMAARFPLAERVGRGEPAHPCGPSAALLRLRAS